MMTPSPRYGGNTQPRGAALVACRAVLFAFEGTLDAHGLAWRERLHRLLLAEGVLVSPARFTPSFDAADRAVVGAVPPSLPLRDTVDRLVSETIRGLGLRDLFGVIIDAADVGVRKPDPRIFRLAVDALGVEPADAVFVGASAAHDMAGARAAGLPHIRVASTADRAVPCCRSDLVVSAVDELGSLLL